MNLRPAQARALNARRKLHFSQQSSLSKSYVGNTGNTLLILHLLRHKAARSPVESQETAGESADRSSGLVTRRDTVSCIPSPLFRRLAKLSECVMRIGPLQQLDSVCI